MRCYMTFSLFLTSQRIRNSCGFHFKPSSCTPCLSTPPSHLRSLQISFSIQQATGFSHLCLTPSRHFPSHLEENPNSSPWWEASLLLVPPCHSAHPDRKGSVICFVAHASIYYFSPPTHKLCLMPAPVSHGDSSQPWVVTGIWLALNQHLLNGWIIFHDKLFELGFSLKTFISSVQSLCFKNIDMISLCYASGLVPDPSLISAVLPTQVLLQGMNTGCHPLTAPGVPVCHLTCQGGRTPPFSHGWTFALADPSYADRRQ